MYSRDIVMNAWNGSEGKRLFYTLKGWSTNILKIVFFTIEIVASRKFVFNHWEVFAFKTKSFKSFATPQYFFKRQRNKKLTWSYKVSSYKSFAVQRRNEFNLIKLECIVFIKNCLPEIHFLLVSFGISFETREERNLRWVKFLDFSTFKVWRTSKIFFCSFCF